MRALAAYNAIEGAPVDCNPITSVVGGPGQNVAGPDGLVMGRFGWVDANGIATNARTDASQRLGFVLRLYGTWQRVYWDSRRWFLRAGLGAQILSRGDFWARFANGADAGQPVYADLLDGQCCSGQTADAELTPWAVVTSCGPNSLAVISTWSKYV